MSKCRVCRGPAVIDLPRHNANFCAEHLQQLCRRQVEKAIKDIRHARARRPRARRGQRRQGLARRVGPPARPRLPGRRAVHRARHRRLQRRESGAFAPAFAAERGLPLQTIDLRDELRLRRPDCGARRRGGCRALRAACRSATCSTTPRATADTTSSRPVTTSTTRPPCCSATRCGGMSTTWPASCPCCRPGDGFPRKVKPLVRLTERETAAWCIARGIDYQVEECPMAAGNRHLGYKATLNALEARSPGTKAAFYLEFLENMAPLLAGTIARRMRGSAGRTANCRPAARRGRISRTCRRRCRHISTGPRASRPSAPYRAARLRHCRRLRCRSAS